METIYEKRRPGTASFRSGVLLYLALAPVKIMSSSVFNLPGLTEIRLYVVTNSLLPAGDIENAGIPEMQEMRGTRGMPKLLPRQIVREHQKQNGPRADGVYELRLYRTEVHYILHREYAYLSAMLPEICCPVLQPVQIFCILPGLRRHFFRRNLFDPCDLFRHIRKV